ncbi:MAG: hypothetical protein B6D64_00775 [Bacteroidetes bacterium 4484_276]|nr:MAG: hypothetical protein B6D64_00775 [Bacteroidetes bacterium 4484_276]
MQVRFLFWAHKQNSKPWKLILSGLFFCGVDKGLQTPRNEGMATLLRYPGFPSPPYGWGFNTYQNKNPPNSK